MYSGMVTIWGRHEGQGLSTTLRPCPAFRAGSYSRARPRPTLGLEFQAKGSDHIIKVLEERQAYIAFSGLIWGTDWRVHGWGQRDEFRSCYDKSR